MHAQRLRCGTMAAGLEALDKPADILIATSRGHENHIRRRGDDEVLDAERRDQGSLPAHVASASIFQHDIADRHVTGPILVTHGPQRRPASDVVPVELSRHHDRPVCLLHDGVVDRYRWTGLERALLEPQEIEVAGRCCQRSAARLQHIGSPHFQFVDERAGRQQEDSTVPKMLIAGQQPLHHREVRLFNEIDDVANVGNGRKSRSRANVAKSRGRFCGALTEQNKSSVARGGQACRHSRPERRGVTHPMVDRHRKNDGVGVCFAGEQCRDRHRRSRVSSEWLEHDGGI